MDVDERRLLGIGIYIIAFTMRVGGQVQHCRTYASPDKV